MFHQLKCLKQALRYIFQSTNEHVITVIDQTLYTSKSKTTQSLPAWFSAAQNNDVNTLRRLQDKCFKSTQGKNKWTALMYSAFNNYEEAVKFLLPRESGLQDSDGMTALMLAAIKGHTNIVKLLIPKEAGMFLPYDTLEFPRGSTALLMAAQQNQKSTVQLLFAAEGKLSQFTHYHLFAITRDINQILMHNTGNNINDQPDLLGRTALSYAFAGKDDGQLQLNVIKALGVSGNQFDVFGRAPIHYAIMGDNMSVMEQLQVQQEHVRQHGERYKVFSYINISNTRSTQFMDRQSQHLAVQTRIQRYGKLTKQPFYSVFSKELTPLMMACVYKAKRLAPRLMAQFGGRQTAESLTALMFSAIFAGPITASLFRLESSVVINQQIGPLLPGSNVFDVAMQFGTDETIQMLNKCRDDALEFGQQSQRWRMVESVLKTQNQPQPSQKIEDLQQIAAEEVEIAQQPEIPRERQHPIKQGSITVQELHEQYSQPKTDNNIESIPVQSLVTEQQIDYAKELIMQYLQTDEKLKGFTVEEILVKLSESTQSQTRNQQVQQKPNNQISNTQSLKVDQLNTNQFVDSMHNRSTGHNLGSSSETDNQWTINQELQNNFNDLHYLQQFALQSDQKIHKLEQSVVKRDKIINKQLIEIKEQLAVNRNLQAQVDELDILMQQLDAVG